MTRKQTDLTTGPITKQLICFAVPLLFGALIQLLYATTDMMFVGGVLGTSAAAAVGASGMIVNCIVAFFTGLSVGVGVVCGKAIGAKDEWLFNRLLHVAAFLTLCIGFGLMLLGVILTPTLLRWMKTPESLMPLATVYLRLYLCSLPCIVSYNVGTGVIKATGDSKSPTVYQLIGGFANVVGNYLFIVVLHQGIVGAALTTLLSQTVAAGLTIRYLCRLPEGYRLRVKQISFDKVLAVNILAVGIPAAVQAVMISLSNVFVQSSINSLDEVSIAAFSAYYKVENFIYFPIMAVGQACSAFVSQNIGARNITRVRRGMQRSLVLGVGVTLVLSAIVVMGAEIAFTFFSKDPDVIKTGSQIATVAFPFYFLYVFLEVFSATIRGSGKAMATMVITIINMVFVRIAVLMVMTHLYPGPLGIAAVYPITWLTTAASMFGYYLSKRWVPDFLKEYKGRKRVLLDDSVLKSE